jgi:hypothetical protein
MDPFHGRAWHTTPDATILPFPARLGCATILPQLPLSLDNTFHHDAGRPGSSFTLFAAMEHLKPARSTWTGSPKHVNHDAASSADEMWQ